MRDPDHRHQTAFSRPLKVPRLGQARASPRISRRSGGGGSGGKPNQRAALLEKVAKSPGDPAGPGRSAAAIAEKFRATRKARFGCCGSQDFSLRAPVCPSHAGAETGSLAPWLPADVPPGGPGTAAPARPFAAVEQFCTDPRFVVAGVHDASPVDLSLEVAVSPLFPCIPVGCPVREWNRLQSATTHFLCLVVRRRRRWEVGRRVLRRFPLGGRCRE